MHPILERPIRLVLYLAAWAPVLALLAYTARPAGDSSWARSAALLAPGCAVFAFTWLSPRYLCRGVPRRFSDAMRLALTWTAASLAGGGVLTGPAWLAASIAGRPS